MRIAVAGPISIRGLRGYLEDPENDIPVGHEGAPLLGTLISALIDRGHEVSAYTLDRGLAAQNAPIFKAKGPNGFRVFAGPYRSHSFRSNGKQLGRMVDMFRHERRSLEQMIEIDMPDIVHAHWTYEYALAAIASDRPHVVTAHDAPLQVLRYIPNLYRLGRYFMARSVFRQSLYVTAVSPYLRDQVQKYTSAPIEVIGNPVPYFVLPGTERHAYRTPDPANLMFGMVLSGWGKLKNAKSGLRAFSLLRGKYRNARLYCYGYDFGEGEVAHTWAKAKGLDAGVTFVGPTPHRTLLSRVGEFDLLIHPALEESCPLTLLEAMALGVPVVGGKRSGGVPWVLDQGKAGMLTDVTSPESISHAVVELLDGSTHRRIASTARDRIERFFTPEAVVRQYESVYEKALANQRFK